MSQAGGRGRGRRGCGPEHAGDAAAQGDDRTEQVRGEAGVSAVAEAEERHLQGLVLREEEVGHGHAGEERGLPLRRRHGEFGGGQVLEITRRW